MNTNKKEQFKTGWKETRCKNPFTISSKSATTIIIIIIIITITEPNESLTPIALMNN